MILHKFFVRESKVGVWYRIEEINFFSRFKRWFRFLIEIVIWKLWNWYIYIYATEYNQKWYDFAWKYKLRNGTKMQSLFFLFEFYFYCSNGIWSNRPCSLPLFNVKILFYLWKNLIQIVTYIHGWYICIMSSTFTHKVARYVSLKLVVVYILVCRLKSG